MRQLRLFQKADNSILLEAGCAERKRIEEKFAPLIREELHIGSLVSYVGNRTVPFLRLYRYKEAFSFRLVGEFIQRFKLTQKDYIFDPFCGMGTTLFASLQRGIPSIGIDKLPIAAFVAQTLPLFSAIQPHALKKTFEALQTKVANIEPVDVAEDVAIMKVAFSPEILLELRRWKSSIDTLDSPLRDVFLLLFFSILEPCSYTSKDGQFLRLVPDKHIVPPAEMLRRQISEAEKDISSLDSLWHDKKTQIPRVQLADARNLQNVHFEKSPTALITSPPYANRYDYTRSYSLELCFHFVRNFEELKALRFGILRSHIESKVDANDHPPHPAVAEVVDLLQERDLNNPRIPDMLTAYFVDMKKVISEWARVLAPGAKVAMVVDNVRFDGELVPIDLILSEMAEEVGFIVKQVIVARYKGNSSQQMGKYGRVPVRESIVVWQKVV